MADPYETLGVPRDADPDVLKAAHRRAAREHHPDKPGGDQARFQAIQSAYDLLRDPDRRAHFDRTGHDQAREPTEAEMIAPLVIGAFDRAVVGELIDTDVPPKMVILLKQDRAQGEAANRQIAAEVAKVEGMMRRLGFTGAEGTNIIASMLGQRLRDYETHRTRNVEAMARIDRAIAHVRLYGWEFEPVPEPVPSEWYASTRTFPNFVT